MTVDPFTGRADVDLSGVRDDRLRLTVDAVRGIRPGAPISLLDVDLPGPPPTRTLVVPETSTTDDASFVFTARPEVRTCITTLIAPDCNYDRGRLSDESLGLDRTFTVPSDGTWSLSGTVIARARADTSQLLDPFLGDGPSAVHASSALAADPTVAVRFAYDGNGATSWMADPYDPAPTLIIDFAKPTKVSRLGVIQPAQPAVTPTEAVIRAGNKTRVVELGDFGVFEPLKVRHLEITFSNPSRGLAPIGIGELFLSPRSVTEPFDGATPTGAVCGFGPQVRVDGRRYPTRVAGFMGNVVSAGPLEMTMCDPDDPDAEPDIELDAGEHHLEIVSTEQYQPVLAALRGGPSTSGAGVAPERSMRVVRDEPSVQRVVVGAGDASLLATTRNYNRGWVATLDGEELPVQRVDGWAQGWRVPAGQGGVIDVRYAPERSYVIVLFGGLALSMLTLLVALGLLAFTRLDPERPLEGRAVRERRGARAPRRRTGGRWRTRATRLGRPVLPVLAVAGAWLAGGVPAAVRARPGRRARAARPGAHAGRPRRGTDGGRTGAPGGVPPARRAVSAAARRHPDGHGLRARGGLGAALAGQVEQDRPRVTGRRRDRVQDLAFSALLAVIALGPLLLNRGFALRGDMVFVPHQPWKDAWLGWDGGTARFVPGDAVLSIVTSVVPGDLLQKVLLLGTFLLAGTGAGLLVRRHGFVARAAAVVVMCWNPWVRRTAADRPVGCRRRLRRPAVGRAGRGTGSRRRTPRASRPLCWLGFTALWSPPSALAGVLTALCVVVVRPRAASVLAVLGSALW